MTRLILIALLVCVSASFAIQVVLHRERGYNSGNKQPWVADLQPSQCQRIPDDDKKKTQSVQLDQGTCVILFEKKDCTGRGVAVGQGITWCNAADLKSCDFKKKAQSVRLC